MILTGPEIINELEAGNIHISPFDSANVSPNAYDFHIGDSLIEYPLDRIALPNDGTPSIIPPSGKLLLPGRLYLGITVEVTGSNIYSQFLNGDRSLGSLGIWVNVTAPLGHVGSSIRWTLEITVIKPVMIYPFSKFGKIAFLRNSGFIRLYSDDFFGAGGKYIKNTIEQCTQYPEFD